MVNGRTFTCKVLSGKREGELLKVWSGFEHGEVLMMKGRASEFFEDTTFREFRV
jgi:hypothetical protein